MIFRCKFFRMRRIAASAAVLLMSLCGAVQFYAHSLPDHFYTDADRPLSVATALPVTFTRRTPSVPQGQEAQLRLFGMFPVKTVSLTTLGPANVYVGGEPFGIRMLMAGVMVISLSEVQAVSGSCCPAAEAGIREGDIIEAVNGRRISSNADIQQAVADSCGEAVAVAVRRGEMLKTVSVQPAYVAEAQRWQTGMWVRDSTAGIGTMTYYTRTQSGQIAFAGLGHAVCDADTGAQIPLASGDVIAVSVRDIVSGSAGRPGELLGRFDIGESIGMLSANTSCGIFGSVIRLPQKQIAVPLGFRQDITRGEALMYTTIDGTAPRPYRIEIEEIRGDDDALRNLVIHVTDTALLENTGGIVQGMSGSPILQNGRLIGAVTHVFVRDPTRGYGIFAENMYAQTAALAASAA
jgi:stage IV sporulation protein B